MRHPSNIWASRGRSFSLPTTFDFCWVLTAHQCHLLSDGRDSVNDRSSRDALSPAEQTLPDPCGEPGNWAHSGRVLDPLYKRVQSQRPDIPRPICPVCFPILGSRCHSASVIPVIRNAEITRVIIFDPNRKTVQEACCGRGNLVLKSVRKLVSDLHSHSLTLPNEREGMSVSAFLTPGLCTGVRGHVCWMFRWRASARTS